MKAMLFTLRFSVFVLLGHAVLDIVNGDWIMAGVAVGMAAAIAVAVALVAKSEEG